MKKKKTSIDFVKQFEKITENVEPKGITEAEADRLTKKINSLHNSLLELDKQRKVAQEMFKRHSEQLMKSNSELVIMNEFIDSKGLRNEYYRFAELKQKGKPVK